MGLSVEGDHNTEMWLKLKTGVKVGEGRLCISMASGCISGSTEGSMVKTDNVLPVNHTDQLGVRDLSGPLSLMCVVVRGH